MYISHIVNGEGVCTIFVRKRYEIMEGVRVSGSDRYVEGQSS